MNFANSKDETLLRFYESVRDQVQADSQFGGKYRFAGGRTSSIHHNDMAEVQSAPKT